MTQADSDQSLPSYSRAWNRLKRFPGGLHKGASRPYTSSGAAAAAFISAGIGSVIMMIVHHLSDTSKERENMVKAIGNWIPGSVNPDPLWGNIGSYAGKETFLLIGWLSSWAVLHLLLKNRQVRPRTLFLWMLSLLTLATAMAWHPLFPYLPLQ
ncbi:MAG: hypothetical protein C4288_22615 [Leptolyngbya sp. ERB_1_1]